MKRIVLFLFILFSIQPTYALFDISLVGSFASKKLTGTEPTTSTDGVLISNGNFNTGLNLTIGLAHSWHLLLGMENRSFEFDNTDNIIAGDTKIDANAIEAGVRWILFARTAFRFLYTSQDEIAFDVNTDNQAVLYKEKLNFLTVYWDQLIYMGDTFLGGFKVGYDVTASGSDITDRMGTRYGAFLIWRTKGWGDLEGYYELKNITKSDADLDYVESDSNFNIIYTVGF